MITKKPSKPALFAVAAVVAVVAVATLRLALVDSYTVPGQSMLPEIGLDQRVHFFAGETNPERGEIVVFQRPSDVPGSSSRVVGRVVGVGGDELEFRDGRVFVDGAELDEPYLADGTQTRPSMIDTPDMNVPDGHVFVMGDNRQNSTDSRVYGAVPIDHIEGTRATFWPSFLP